MTGRYAVLLTPSARRALADDPWRVGKPLHGPYEGLHAARRGTYRVLYKIDEGKHAIEIRSIRHRADAYRT